MLLSQRNHVANRCQAFQSRTKKKKRMRPLRETKRSSAPSTSSTSPIRIPSSKDGLVVCREVTGLSERAIEKLSSYQARFEGFVMRIAV